MKKEIYAFSVDPKDSIFKADRSDRAKNVVILCEHTEDCPLYARKQCLMLNASGACPGGEKITVTGPTPRAASYHRFLSDFRKAHEGTYRNGLSSCKKFSRVPGGVFFPIAYVTLFEKVKWLSGGKGLFDFAPNIMDEADYTPENMAALITFVPRPMFGPGIIAEYQKEEVPKLIRQLREEDPRMYGKVMELLPDDVRERFAVISNVGRKAMLFSTVPGKGVFEDCHKAHWRWDGEYLTSTDSRAMFLICDKYSELRIKPAKDFEVTITDDAQADENTIFTN